MHWAIGDLSNVIDVKLAQGYEGLQSYNLFFFNILILFVV
jgi:hypothetical protein